MSHDKHIKFTWDAIQTAIESLAYRLEPSKPLGIVGVSRGGLVPATMLSHKMDLPLNIIWAGSYGKNYQQHRVELSIGDNVRREVNANPSRWIIIDDVLDSGNTYDALRAQFPVSMYAVIVTKRLLLSVSAFAHVPQGVWIQFPWE